MAVIYMIIMNKDEIKENKLLIMTIERNVKIKKITTITKITVQTKDI